MKFFFGRFTLWSVIRITPELTFKFQPKDPAQTHHNYFFSSFHLSVSQSGFLQIHHLCQCLMLFNQFHIFLPGLALGPVRAYQSASFIFNHFLYLSYTGSRLSVKSLSTAKLLGLVPALAPAVILNRGPR